MPTSRIPSRRFGFVVSAAIALVPAASAAPGGGGVLRLNDFTSSRQDQVALDLLADGRLLAVWHSRRQDGGKDAVRARIVRQDDVASGPELRFDGGAPSSRSSPAVAASPDGGAWFAWTAFGQDGDRGAVLLRRFGADLVAATGEILAAEPAGDACDAALAAGLDGGALAVWSTGSGTRRELRVRGFGAEGAPLGPERTLSSPSSALATCASVERCGSGVFLVVWSVHGESGRPEGVRARTVDRLGAPLSEELRLDDPVAAGIEPVLASDPARGAAVAWLVPEADRYRIAYRRLAIAGGGSLVPSGRELVGEQPARASGLAVALASDGELAFTWSELDAHGREADLHVVRVGADGVALGGARTFEASGDQRIDASRGSRRSLFDARGRLVVAWSGDGGAGDSTGAHLTIEERFLDARPPVRDIAGACAEEKRAEPHDPPTFDPAAPAPVLPPQASMSAVGPDWGFPGITSSGWNPPDPHLAVGPDHLVLVTNGRIQICDRAGVATSSQPLEGALGLWGAAGAGWFVFDPEVAFDPGSQRFFVAAVERDAGIPYFLLAVSDDADPNGAWHTFRIDVGALALDHDIDSTNLSVGDDWVALGADFFNPDQHFVYVLDKNALVGGALPQGNAVSLPNRTSAALPQVAAGTDEVLLVRADLQPAASDIDLIAISDPLGAATTLVTTLPVPPYTAPENPPQLGASQRPETFDARVWSVAYAGGSLWATHHVGGNRVLQRWYEIALNGWPAVTGATPSLAQWGEVDLGPEVRTCFGAIAADGQGNVAMVFTRTSPTEPLSIARCLRTASDPPGTMRPAETVQLSTAPDTSGRWGDYGAVVPDPALPGAFWAHHEVRFATWTTWVSLLGVPTQPASFCTAKTTSLGLLPAIQAATPPSIGSGVFRVGLSNAVPGAPAVLMRAFQPAAHPFHGGTMCLAPPRDRIDRIAIDASGAAEIDVPISIADFGRPMYLQYWFRDGQHIDGQGTGLSDGLQAVPGP